MGATRREYLREATPGPLDITIAEQGTTTTISLHGEWDFAQQSAMRAAISDILARSPECVVLDLSCLDFIDSTGIHGVIELQKRSQQQRARLVIVPGPGQVQRTFELVGLTEILPFLSDGRVARPRSARTGAAGSGGSLSPPSATPAAARPSRGRRR